MDKQTASEAAIERKFVSAKEAADVLAAHPNTLRRWAKAGALPHFVTAGGQYRYDVAGYLACVARDPRSAA
jgi:excisionase family DNA binding protein